MKLSPLLTAAKAHGLVVALLLAALAAGAWFLPGLLLGPQVPVATVVSQDFIQSVVASGHVEAPHRVSIGTQVTGTVSRIRVREGQDVRAGQVLVELQSTELQAAVAQADMAVRQAQARLRQVREVQGPVADQTLQQAEVTRQNAHVQLLRNRDLLAKGYIGQATLDEAQKAADLADAQLKAAEKQRDTARPSGSDYAVAATALAEARASADAARSRLAYATITAPVAGTLIDRSVETGDVVQPGKTLMVLSPTGETQLVVQIDEKNLRLLAEGQPAQVSADAYPDERFAASLVYINPGVDAQRGSVEAKLTVPDPPPYLMQDMTVSVDIRVATRANAVLAPTDTIRDVNTPKPWVLKVEANRAHRQPIRLGLHSGGLSEVLEGLKPGDLLVPGSASAVRDGSRLRPITGPARR